LHWVVTLSKPFMNRTQLRTRIAQEEFCKNEIDRMLKNSQTKAIMPVITIELLDEHIRSGKQLFNDSEIEAAYRLATKKLTHFLRHDIYIGAKYYDAYGSRMSRYGVLKPLGHLKYKLLPPYTETAEALVDWIPTRIKHHIQERLGIVPTLQDPATRTKLSRSAEHFLNLVHDQINKTPANFEIFSFAVLKVHLEKFACKIYRDTRTAAHDQGVDLSTNLVWSTRSRNSGFELSKKLRSYMASLNVILTEHGFKMAMW